jgi:hypothetical protein
MGAAARSHRGDQSQLATLTATRRKETTFNKNEIIVLGRIKKRLTLEAFG